MNEDDAKILQEVQKNTKMAALASELISSRVYDEQLAADIKKQEMRYQSIYQNATGRLLEEKKKSYQSSGLQELMLKSAIAGNTMLNDSTSHVAELMIQGNNRGLTDMWKILNHHKNAGKESVELAKELMDFEEKCIRSLKVYL